MPSALITGTSKGIGLETALAFARAGYKVFAGMRHPAKSPELAAIAAREKLPIFVSALDVDSDESVARGFAAIARGHGAIDVLVNNAGIEVRGSVEELPLAGFRTTMETNYFGVIRCVQQVIPQMRQRRGGVIINVSSIAGRIPSPPMASYNASKWALEGLTEALAGEMKTFNVRVLLVEPGSIDPATAERSGEAPAKAQSLYRQTGRFASMFVASLKNSAPPTLVAQKNSGRGHQRNLDAAPSGRPRRRTAARLAQNHDRRTMDRAERLRRRILVHHPRTRLRLQRPPHRLG